MAKQTALRIVPMPTDNDDRERPTDRVHAVPDAPINFKDPVFPPSGVVPAEAKDLAGDEPEDEAAVEDWLGYDESQFMHRATAAVVKGTNELLKARQIWDIESIVKRQAVLFKEALAPELGAFSKHMQKSDGEMRDLRSEFDRMKIRMTQIEAALNIKTPTQ